MRARYYSTCKFLYFFEQTRDGGSGPGFVNPLRQKLACLREQPPSLDLTGEDGDEEKFTHLMTRAAFVDLLPR